MIKEANKDIAALQREAVLRRERLERLDRIIRSIDALLWELEDLNLQEVDRVPVGLRERAQAVLEMVLPDEDAEALKVRYRIVPLMDVLYRAQEVLFRRKHPHADFADEEEAVP